MLLFVVCEILFIIYRLKVHDDLLKYVCCFSVSRSFLEFVFRKTCKKDALFLKQVLS